MAFNTFSLADTFLKAESAKGAQTRNALMGRQMEQMNADAARNDILTLGRFSQQLLESPDPVGLYNQSLPQLRSAVTSPGILEKLNPTNDPNEILTEAQQIMQLAQSFAPPQDANLPAGFIQFQRTAEAAGLQPGTPEYERAASVALGLAPRASSAAVKTVTFKGSDGRERLFLVDAQGTVLGPANETMVSPTEQESAHDVALGKGRGSAQAEAEANAPKLKLRAQQQIAAIDNTFNAIDKALEEVDWSTAGPAGSAAASIAGTDAYNLRQTILTIKANIGFDRLQQMRESSPTGGALGQVSNQELDALQATIASLDQAQTPGQLRANLKKVRQHYENWKNTIKQWKAGSTDSKTEQPEQADPLGIRY